MKWIVLLAALAAQSSHAEEKIVYVSAGGVDGGGGKGVYCEANGRRTVESLDLYEARNVWGYTLPTSRDFEAEMRRVMPQYWAARFDLDPTQPPLRADELSFRNFMDFYETSFRRQMRFITEGTRIRPTEDATIILDPPAHCKIVQILVYLDEGSGTGGILADREYWNLLDDQNKLALALHETDYKAYRHYLGVRSSDSIRKYIGAIFSTDHAPNQIEAVRSAKDALRCESKPERSDWVPTLFYVTSIEGEPGRVSFPKSLLHFIDISPGFGSKFGPVEYKASSMFDLGKFVNEPGDGAYAGSEILEINSILGGIKIELEASTPCSSCERPISFKLIKREPTGSAYEEPISCKRIQPYRG